METQPATVCPRCEKPICDDDLKFVARAVGLEDDRRDEVIWTYAHDVIWLPPKKRCLLYFNTSRLIRRRNSCNL
jgi:hypothetical protein